MSMPTIIYHNKKIKETELMNTFLKLNYFNSNDFNYFFRYLIENITYF